MPDERRVDRIHVEHHPIVQQMNGSRATVGRVGLTHLPPSKEFHIGVELTCLCGCNITVCSHLSMEDAEYLHKALGILLGEHKAIVNNCN